MRTLALKKQRRLFLAQATKLLVDSGARRDGGETYEFTLQTTAGLLRLHPEEDRLDGLGTVFACFDDPQAARELVNCNVLDTAQAAEHAQALDMLIDGEDDELGEMLKPVRDFLRQVAGVKR